MLSTFISMAIFAFIGAVTPGPVNIIATSTAARFGFRGALPHVLGATVGYTLVVFLMGVGLGSLILVIPEISMTMQYLGAGFLLYMAYRIASASTPGNIPDDGRRNPPSFFLGCLVQVLNPKAWLVSMSGVGLFVTANAPFSLYLMVFCSISFCACFAGVAIWAASGQVIGRYLSGHKRQPVFNILMGSLLAGSVLFMFI
jgi:threonine/homoserine/homoserine lactone efflux protein